MSTYVGVIFNEDINSNLIKSQFIKPLETLKENGSNVRVVYFSKPGKKTNIDTGLEVDIYPFAVPYSIFLYGLVSYILVPILLPLYMIIFSILFDKKEILIIRGYFPSLVYALVCFFSKCRKFIFDPRSLFVQESLVSKKLSKGNGTYQVWTVFEKLILTNSYKVICVSSKQIEYYEAIADSTYLLIPCYSSASNSLSLNYCLPEDVSGFFSDFRVVICYFGSMDQGWNNINDYAEFVDFLSHDIGLIVISQNYEELKLDSRFSKRNVFILGDINHKDKINIMASCDYGVFLMKDNPDWETRLGVKFADYLSVGLPVIISPYVGEAVNYIEKHELNESFVLDENMKMDFSQLIQTENKTRSKYTEKSKQLFSYGNFLRVREM